MPLYNRKDLKPFFTLSQVVNPQVNFSPIQTELLLIPFSRGAQPLAKCVPSMLTARVSCEGAMTARFALKLKKKMRGDFWGRNTSNSYALSRRSLSQQRW